MLGKIRRWFERGCHTFINVNEWMDDWKRRETQKTKNTNTRKSFGKGSGRITGYESKGTRKNRTHRLVLPNKTINFNNRGKIKVQLFFPYI